MDDQEFLQPPNPYKPPLPSGTSLDRLGFSLEREPLIELESDGVRFEYHKTLAQLPGAQSQLLPYTKWVIERPSAIFKDLKVNSGEDIFSYVAPPGTYPGDEGEVKAPVTGNVLCVDVKRMGDFILIVRFNLMTEDRSHRGIPVNWGQYYGGVLWSEKPLT